ncbi:MAG: hypothetical protein ACYDGR_00210 [Candidatus Dormibacteria bacterium]
MARDPVFTVGRVGGLDVSFSRGAVPGSLVLWVLYALVGRLAFDKRAGSAVRGGLVLVALHWLAEYLHNLGHAAAARSVGYPMTGVRMGDHLLFGTSLYPDDEPELPPDTHIKRALGGPFGSLGVAAAGSAASLVSAGTEVGWVPTVFALENLLVFTLGNVVPVGFNDASTIIREMKRR